MSTTPRSCRCCGRPVTSMVEVDYCGSLCRRGRCDHDNDHRTYRRLLAKLPPVVPPVRPVPDFDIVGSVRRRPPVPPYQRPAGCCGACPPVVGGGYDCRCDAHDHEDAGRRAVARSMERRG